MKNFSKVLQLFFLTDLMVIILNINTTFSQCTVNIAPINASICFGQSISLYSITCGGYIMYDDFNSGSLNTNWSSNCNPLIGNPCSYTYNSTSVYDGTPCLWVGNSTSYPREMTTISYPVTSANHICFDMVYSIQSVSAPCEGPDLSNEGIHVQYSTNGGSTWTDIHYYPPDDPNCAGSGGYDVCMTSWNTYCLDVPALAVSDSTQFRWYQDITSGNNYDNWALDNVQIFLLDSTIVPSGSYSWFDNDVLFSNNNSPGIYYPSLGSHEIVTHYTDSVSDSFDTVYVNVVLSPNIELGPDTTTCASHLITLTLPAGYSSYLWSTGQNTNSITIDSTGIGYDSTLIYVTVTNSGNCLTTDSITVIFQNCTEVEKNVENNILIYPNPTKSILNVDFGDSYTENSFIQITDIHGYTLIKERVSKNTFSINVSKFQSGIYLLTLSNNKLVFRKKLIIQ